MIGSRLYLFYQTNEAHLIFFPNWIIVGLDKLNFLLHIECKDKIAQKLLKVELIHYEEETIS